ncbi:MAG TPA: LptA/OstA family protein [Candidatus Binatia bacterium]|nr:LptA/OstA family protein [Candidatus Binatia bacterium]
MLPRRELLAVLLSLSVLAARADAAPANDAATAPGSPGLFDLGGVGHSKEPITVTSDRLDYDYKANVVVYRGNVEAVQGQATLKSDTLTVTFENDKTNDKPAAGAVADPPPASAKKAPSADPGDKGTSRVKEIVAVGSVRIDQGTRWATGGHAVFDQGTRTVVLTENPVLHDGPNEVAGDKVIVYLDENRSVVEGGRKRVKAVIHPGTNATNTAASAAGGTAAAPAAEVAHP